MRSRDSRLCPSLLFRMYELVSEAAQGCPQGSRQGARSGLQRLAGALITQRRHGRLGYPLPGSGECGEGLPDLLFVWAIVAGRAAIDGLDLIAESRELRRETLPRILLVGCRRIGVVLLHLLDGTYELFRAHFGRKDTVLGSDGQDLRATLGIIESTLALLREDGVTHLAASFDTVIESFRNDIFIGYKTSAGIEPGLLAQFPIAEMALESIGVVVWRNVEFEADDAIAAAAVRWVEDVDQVVILSPDKDLMQAVIGERIVTYNRRDQKLFDEEAVRAKFGIRPESIPDYLALVGDSADGVPGLAGWGAKSAAAVLAVYPRLELIPPSEADWDVQLRSAARLAGTLRDHQEEAYLYRELTTLRLDVPIEESLEDLEWRGVPKDRFVRFCEGLGLDHSAIRVHRWAQG